MTLDQAQQAYTALPAASQARFLAKLAYELTVWARSAYPELLPDSNLIIQRLRAGNELQHRVTAQLAHVLNQKPERYPDEVLVAILFDFASPAGCERELTLMFQDLHAAYLRKASKADGKQATEDPTTTSAVP